MKFKITYILIATALLLTSCGEKEPAKKKLEFNSTIIESQSGDQWSAQDNVGVFMVKTSTFDVVNNSSNISYTTNGDGKFTSSAAIELKKDNGKVDIISYYPYKSNLSDFAYEINLANQDNQKLLDIRYANNIKGIDINYTTLTLNFARQLSKVEINIIKGEESEDFEVAEVNVNGMIATGSLNLQTGVVTADEVASTPIKTLMADNKAFATLMPTQIADQTIAVKLTDDQEVLFDIKDAISELQKGKKHEIPVTVTKLADKIVVEVSGKVTDWETETGTGSATDK